MLEPRNGVEDVEDAPGRLRVAGDDLVGGDDHLGRALAVELGDRRRGDDLGAVARRRVDSFTGNPGSGSPLAVPGVEVLVERAGDDVEPPVAVEVGERRRAEEAALDVVVGR